MSDLDDGQYEELKGFYYVHEEIGHGGFGKVKLATHLLTGKRVAVKIIDKKAIGDDLPRVANEMDALRNLSHQSICRLYHYIESKEKFFIVMEYCSGGEMFDYIVKKERLEEPEARHFFRQLVQAMAYVHSQGYAHRDLKPENILLTDDLQLRVIDFGLCAKPGILSNPLSTCCGSPAYAAPELVSGLDYHGDRADIWSMGVLLYALVCGSLPFEDDNNAVLFRKIQSGKFHLPDYLSPAIRNLMIQMMTADPEKRITMQAIIKHPWLNHNYIMPLKWSSIYDKNFVDDDVARELAYHHGISFNKMVSLIKEWKFDYLTACYYILLGMKRKGERFNLPPPVHTVKGEKNMIASPTLHASLERNLDKLELEDSEHSDLSESAENGREVRFAKPLSPDKKKISYVNAMMNMPVTVCTGRSPQQRLYDSPVSTPGRIKTVARHQNSLGFEDNKENRSASVRVRGPVKVLDDHDGSGTIRPKSIYSTPQRPPLKSLFSPGSHSQGSRPRARSTDRSSTGSPVSLGSSENSRTPRSTTKGPTRLRHRVFASLERKKDQVINLLTPRKIKNDSPQVLKTTKGLVNVSITSAKDPERVRAELVQVFEQQEMEYECSGWKISGRKRENNHEMTVELEVVMVETLGFVGIKRKRLAGDAFMYKKVCEKILKMAGL